MLAHHEIDIDAPVERVWRIHTDVARWPEWQAEITDARIDGPFEPDTAFDLDELRVQRHVNDL